MVYLVYTLFYEVETAPIGKSSQLAIFHAALILLSDQRFSRGCQLYSMVRFLVAHFGEPGANMLYCTETIKMSGEKVNSAFFSAIHAEGQLFPVGEKRNPRSCNSKLFTHH